MALIPRKTYPELSALTAPVEDADVLALYRTPGPLRRATATVFADYVGGELTDNGTIPSVASRATLADLSIKAAIKQIATRGYASEGDGGGWDSAVRKSYADIVSEGIPAAAYQRSIDRYMPDESTDATNGGYWLLNEKVAEPEHLGAKGDGVADDTTAMTALGALTTTHQKRLRNTYKITAEIAFNIGDQVEGDGAGTIIDGSTIASFSGSGGIVKTTGASGLVQIADLAADPVKGGITVTLTDASTLEVGDWICLYNPTDNSWLPSPFPAVYREGEWCRVQSVDAGTDVVTLFEPLWRSYTAANMDVYRLRSGSPTFRNLTIKGPPLERSCLYIDCAIRPVVENVFTQGTEYAGIRVQRSMEPQINCDLFTNPETGTPSNEYGLQLSAVNGGEIRGSYYAQRHGIAFGGDDFVCMVPNRKTKVFADTSSSVNLSLDVGGHGCSEGLVVVGGTHGGLATGGANMRFIGATFRMGSRASGSASSVVGYSEGKGGDFIFDSCVFELLATAASSNLINLFLQAGNDEGPRFHFNNCIYKDTGGNAYPIRCFVAGTTTEAEIYVNGGWVGMSSFARMVQVQRSSGASAIKAVVVRDVDGLATNATLIGNGSGGSLTITKQIGDKGVTQSGVATIAVAGTTNGTVAVTFPTPYAAAPVFVPSVQDTVGNWSVSYSSLTASGVTIKIIETGGTARTGSVQVGWIAQPASQAAV